MQFEEFNKKLSDQEAQGIFTLQFAFTMGPIIFSAIVIFLAFTASDQAVEQDFNLIHTLFIVVAVLSFTSIIAFVMLPKIRYKNDAILAIFESDNPVTSFMELFRSTRILQIALLEGAAIFSVVVCLLAHFNGILPAHSKYWAGLSPVIIFVFFSLTNFPTKNHLYHQFKHLQDNYSLIKKN